ncbi:MAG: M48 family metallopeptidase [Spirochaetes bacterium]|nr:M48 family metallopeptidase [Spirochaetota bacterium]
MNYYLIFILAVIIGTYILEIVVELLNLRHIAPGLPEEFKGWYDEDKYKTSQLYLQKNTMFGLVNKTFFTIAILVFILAGGFNSIDIFARSFGFGPIITGLLFTGILVAAYQILELPFEIYDTFVIENKFGFNTTTPGVFILDIIKGALIGAVIGGVVYACVLWFFGKFESWAWLYCWTAVTLIQIFFLFLAPVVIFPLFNKFMPLEEGPLKEAVEKYAVTQGFKMKGLFKIDGSKRSTKSNAYFTGFGRFRRIVLFDTLIEKHSVEELVAVLAHEMGHYKMKHILKNIVTAIILSGSVFWLLSLFINNPGLFNAFRMEKTSIYASLVFFGFLYAPVSLLLSVFGNTVSRKHEYEADEYSVKTGNNAEALITALKKLSVDNLTNLTPHPAIVLLKYSHPPVIERIKKIREAITAPN